VKADPGQIEQALMNLVVNARDAMPQGGKLTIETTSIEVDEIFVQRYSFAFKPGWYVLLSVHDTGIGMDTETQAHIFEPFFTTKGKDVGTGLGLATVYGVVKQSGGYIEVLSELGHGTRFKIYLPRIDETPQPAAETAKSANNLHGQETILVVEDEASLRKLTCNVLRSLGYNVLSAGSGTEAIELTLTNPDVQLLLTDVVMPGVNGCALAQKLSQQYRDLRVIYMSGYTGQGVGNHGTDRPNGWFLAKPFTQELLAQKVRAALDSNALVVAW
jgi:CheY-like chemotaxis protein